MSNEVLVSVRRAGPAMSIDKSIVRTSSDTEENGIMFILRRVSIRWQAAREDDADVITLDALCQAEIQYGSSFELLDAL